MNPDQIDHVHVHRVITESIKQHGHTPHGQRAHLEEMLARDDIPKFLKSQMQMALNRHTMRENHERHATQQLSATTHGNQNTPHKPAGSEEV